MKLRFGDSVVKEREKDNSGLHGVGFVTNQRTRNALLEWEPVSCRLARIRLKGNPANVSIISTYAPIRDATETIKDDFYGELQQLSSSIAARGYLIVAGDFNARVGPSDQTTRKILVKFGQGHRCENGQRVPYDIELDTPTRAEILKAIKTLRNHKAPGEDGLPPELYKQCPEVTAD
ncbi:hypothetical protein QYM36_012893 [Artemia franciscana]|uniref:Endonuclease/exonuclease/phosphatase domain-containing protein n=1 Tax=Artemia franciscana TaxID=6661 RepID=A0AA88HQB6_ARTSF|nr:hypothetical protein QYM36_012893 [Artemia franciscana]